MHEQHQGPRRRRHGCARGHAQPAGEREPGTPLDGAGPAMQAGASGVAVGRNIWGHASPARMTAAIAAIVHGNASVDEAMAAMG